MLGKNIKNEYVLPINILMNVFVFQVRVNSPEPLTRDFVDMSDNFADVESIFIVILKTKRNTESTISDLTIKICYEQCKLHIIKLLFWQEDNY